MSLYVEETLAYMETIQDKTPANQIKLIQDFLEGLKIYDKKQENSCRFFLKGFMRSK